MEEATLFECIPVEIQVMILAWLPVKDAIRSTLTCKRFHTLVYRYRRFSKEEAERVYRFAMKHSFLTFITGTLFRNYSLNPAANRNLAIRVACMEGCAGIVEHLLNSKDYPGFDPAAEGNWPVQLACKYGRLDVLRLLLKDPRVDPTARDDHAMEAAFSEYCRDAGELCYVRPDLPALVECLRGDCYLDILKELLIDGRVDFGLGGKVGPYLPPWATLLSMACSCARMDVVVILLQKGADPGGDSNDPLVSACGTEPANLELVKFLLATGRIDPCHNSGPLLHWIRSNADSAVAKLLLENHALRAMYEEGHDL